MKLEVECIKGVQTVVILSQSEQEAKELIRYFNGKFTQAISLEHQLMEKEHRISQLEKTLEQTERDKMKYQALEELLEMKDKAIERREEELDDLRDSLTESDEEISELRAVLVDLRDFINHRAGEAGDDLYEEIIFYYRDDKEQAMNLIHLISGRSLKDAESFVEMVLDEFNKSQTDNDKDVKEEQEENKSNFRNKIVCEGMDPVWLLHNDGRF